MTASLPMYDRPETAASQQRLWAAIRAMLGEGPQRLHRPSDLMAHWLDPGLILSQTCGLPYRTRLHGQVNLVGTPDYALPDCPAGYYRSVIVLRADDPRDTPASWPDMRFACNAAESQSGWAAPAAYMAARGLRFNDIRLTGSHVASARAVAEGRADLASLDAQCWRQMLRWDAWAQTLQVAAQTPPTPGLPLITSRGRDAATIADTVRAAIAGLPAEDRAALDLHGLERIPPVDYMAVTTPQFPDEGPHSIARSGMAP